MKPLTDWQLISILFMAVLLVVFIDDGAAERWCETYSELCGNEQIAIDTTQSYEISD